MLPQGAGALVELPPLS